MSKRKPWWQDKQKISIIDHIDFIRQNAKEQIHRHDAQGFYDFFVRNGYLTDYMKKRGLELTRLLFPERLESKKKNHERKTNKKWGKHYLYGITDGEHLKDGYSMSPKRRLRQLQTGRSKSLKLVWQCLCAYNDSEAKVQERKLHRRLKKHKVKNEWFEFDCLVICRSWRILHIEEMRQRYLNFVGGEELEIELDKKTLEQLHKNGHW